MINQPNKVNIIVKPAGAMLVVGVLAILSTVIFLKPQKASLAVVPETAPIDAFRSHKAHGQPKSVFDSREAMQPVSLPEVGTLDWVVWGISDSQKSVHKRDSDNSIGGFTLLHPEKKILGVGQRGPSRGLNWTGGTPVASSRVTYAGVHIDGENGFQFPVTVPDKAAHTLRVYTGGLRSSGEFTAAFPGGVTVKPTVQDIALQEGYYSRVYTVAIPPAKSGQKLTVEWKRKDGGGNISLLAAALQ